MKAQRSQCAIFWLVSAKAQAALMKAHYDDDGTDLAIPPAPETSSNWETRVAESVQEMKVIMREKPQGMRRVE